MGLDSETVKKIRELKAKKMSLSEIQKETGVSKPTIIKYIKSTPQRKPKKPPSTEVSSMIENSEAPQRPAETIEDYDVEFIDPLGSAHETVVDVKGFPINKKLFLTPKNITLFDCFKRVYPNWDGDISDFVNESMDYTFKALKMEMKISIGGISA